MNSSYKIVMILVAVILISGGLMFITQIKSDTKQNQIDKTAVQELSRGCRSWNELVGLENYLEYTTNISLEDSARIYMDAVSLGHFREASKLAIRFANLEGLAETMFSYNGFNPAVTISSASGAPVKVIVNYSYSQISDFCAKNKTPLR